MPGTSFTEGKVMSLAGWFTSGRTTIDWMRLAQEIAITARALLRRSVDASRLPESRSEARGYVRAKSTPHVRQALGLHLVNIEHTVTDEQLNWLHAEATERVVRLVLDDLLRRRHVADEHLRKAA